MARTLAWNRLHSTCAHGLRRRSGLNCMARTGTLVTNTAFLVKVASHWSLGLLRSHWTRRDRRCWKGMMQLVLPSDRRKLQIRSLDLNNCTAKGCPQPRVRIFQACSCGCEFPTIIWLLLRFCWPVFFPINACPRYELLATHGFCRIFFLFTWRLSDSVNCFVPLK